MTGKKVTLGEIRVSLHKVAYHAAVAKQALDTLSKDLEVLIARVKFWHEQQKQRAHGQKRKGKGS